MWGDDAVYPSNRFCWHITLGTSCAYRGDWASEDPDEYTYDLGDVWLAVAELWHDEDRDYGQLIFDADHLRAVLDPCLDVELPRHPHMSFRLDA